MSIWGLKTISLFDVWSFEHFLGGITLGATVMYFLKKKKDRKLLTFLLIVAGLAYFWELIEYQLEVGRSGIYAVTYWFQGVEFWANRLIADPLLGLAGALIGRNYAITIKPAKLVSISWYLVHIFVFPHCMYLQILLG